MLQKVASLAFTHLLHFSIFLVSYIIAFSSYTFFFQVAMRFLHLRVSFLSLLSFCILMYFVMVAKHIFHLSLVFASISFQSFQQCVFYFGVAGCMNFFLSVLIFCFCIVLFNLPRYAIALFFPFFSIANMLNYVDFARRPLVFADFHSKPT